MRIDCLVCAESRKTLRSSEQTSTPPMLIADKVRNSRCRMADEHSRRRRILRELAGLLLFFPENDITRHFAIRPGTPPELRLHFALTVTRVSCNSRYMKRPESQ